MLDLTVPGMVKQLDIWKTIYDLVAITAPVAIITPPEK